MLGVWVLVEGIRHHADVIRENLNSGLAFRAIWLKSPLWFRLALKPERAHMHGSQRVEEKCEDLGPSERSAKFTATAGTVMDPKP